MHYGFDGWWGGFGMLVGGIFWIAVLALIIWVVVRLTSSQASSTQMPSTPAMPSASEILKARYARGEITKAEFEEIRKDLN